MMKINLQHSTELNKVNNFVGLAQTFFLLTCGPYFHKSTHIREIAPICHRFSDYRVCAYI